MANYVLARAAYEDLEDVERYTLEQWGVGKLVEYIHGLFDQFALIANNPGIGRLRPELAEGVCSLPYEQHVVFYEMYDERCQILRVLHSTRAVQRAFP